MLEIFYPVLLHAEKVNIYIALAQFFMDERSLNFGEIGEKGVFDKMDAFVNSIPEKQVNDDKTVVVIVNDAINCDVMDDDYYKVPDWAALQKKRAEEFKRLAYPHLYTKENENEKDSDNSTPEESNFPQGSTNAENTSTSATEPPEENNEIENKSTANTADIETTDDRSEDGNKPSSEDNCVEYSKKEGISGIFKQITSVFKSKSKKE